MSLPTAEQILNKEPSLALRTWGYHMSAEKCPSFFMREIKPPKPFRLSERAVSMLVILQQDDGLWVKYLPGLQTALPPSPFIHLKPEQREHYLKNSLLSTQTVMLIFQ